MKIKNAAIEDFDIAYEYIRKLWDYNTYDYNATKEVYEKVLEDENSFAFFAVEDDGTYHGLYNMLIVAKFMKPPKSLNKH